MIPSIRPICQRSWFPLALADRLPSNSALRPSDFAGQTLEGIRALYLGSAGGEGYDISWAQDAAGHAVFLPAINFVRIEVVDGKSEVDGVAAVFVPRGLNR